MSQPAHQGDWRSSTAVWVGQRARDRVEWSAGRLVTLGGVTLVAAVAFMMRWPALWHWPAFTDETREVVLALSVARGEQLVWTNINTYMGPLHVYLTAAALALTDASVLAPRLLVLILNLAAVALTGLLAARLAGRTAGVVAGLLAAIAPMWVINNSHVAWSANTTPTYVMTALMCAQIALGRAAPQAGARAGVDAPLPRLTARRGGWLIAAGAFVGLAGQAHPTGGFAAGGIVLALVWGRDGWRRLGSPWPWAALAAMVVAYAPVLVHALVVAPERTASEVAFIGGRRGLGAGVLPILARAPEMWWNEARMAAGVADPAMLLLWSAPLVVAATLLLLGLAGVGTWALLRRGEPLLPLSVLPWLALPALTAQTGEIFVDRYAAPLVGVLAVLVGVALASIGLRRPLLAITLAGLLTLLPLTATASYHGRRSGDYNAVVMAVADRLAPSRGCIQIVLDQRLAGQTALGGGTVTRALRMTLDLAGIPHQTARYHDQTLRDIENLSGARARGDVVVAIVTPPTIAQLSPATMRRLTPVETAPPDSGVQFTVFTYRASDLPVCAPPATLPPVVPRTPVPDGD